MQIFEGFFLIYGILFRDYERAGGHYVEYAAPRKRRSQTPLPSAGSSRGYHCFYGAHTHVSKT